MLKTRRPMGRLFYWLIVMVLMAIHVPQMNAAGPATTAVADVIYRADGGPAKGTLVISWPSFTAKDGEPVAAGVMSVAIGEGGAVQIPLVPNSGASPAGTHYKVVLKLDDGTTDTEYWVVPNTPSTTVGAIRSKVVPTAVAAQFVSRNYVDEAMVGMVHAAGNESIEGIKRFTAQPQVPVPASSLDAANKQYVDETVQSVMNAWAPSQLVIKNASGAARATIDATGNGTFAGIVSAPLVSVSGTPSGNTDADTVGARNAALTGKADDLAVVHISGDETVAGNKTFMGDMSAQSASAQSINGMPMADRFAGPDICAKIAAAIAALPSGGGTVDARGLQGAQTCSSDPLAGVGSKVVMLLLGNATITTTATWSMDHFGLTIRGSGRLATNILMATNNIPIFKASGQNNHSVTFQDFCVRYVNQQTTAMTNAYAFMFYDNQDSFGTGYWYHWNRINIEQAYIGIGQQNLVGRSGLWGIELNDVTIRYTAYSAIWKGSAISTGAPTIVVTNLKIMNTNGGPVPTGPAIYFAGITDGVFMGLDIEGWNNTIWYNASGGTAAFYDLHVEHHTWTGTNPQLFYNTGSQLVLETASISGISTASGTASILNFSSSATTGYTALRNVISNVTVSSGVFKLVSTGATGASVVLSNIQDQLGTMTPMNATELSNVKSWDGTFPSGINAAVVAIGSNQAAISSTSTDLVLKDGGGHQALRTLNTTTGWNDSYATQWYQMGDATTGALFSGNAAQAFGRSAFLTNGFQLLTAIGQPAPTCQFEMYSASTKNTCITSAGKATFNAGVAPSSASSTLAFYKVVTHAALDLASVATALCTAETTETVTGAALGDMCTVSAGTALQAGGVLACKVTATDTVKWQFCNLSPSAIDRSSDTYTIRVIR